MRTNSRMTALLGDADLRDLGSPDIPPLFREVADRGWSTTASGARVLTDLRPEGPAEYLDRLAEETTVNGRGMTDYDLPAAAHERTPLLLRRCLAYLCAALRAAQKEFGDSGVKGYVSLSFADSEDALLTAHVTFCRPLPDVPSYVADLERVENEAVAEISVEDCRLWS
ncbi:hypothetical protein ACFQ6Q_31965 [Streptomyces sp. NPDC056437]|uniref:hypothetical protein n=1 Tax=Streptomyces sp. NPDC056437 TaxID=3345816 RepID=UPI00367DCF87